MLAANAWAQVPASPTSLTAVGGTSSIGLTWQHNLSNVQGFKVERKIGVGGTWGLYATLTGNFLGYTDTGVVAGNTYYYRVYAYNASGPSQFYSNEAFASLQGVPAAPTSLTAVGGTSSIGLTWQHNLSNVQGFKVERKIGVGGTWGLYATLTGNFLGYTDTGVVVGNTYYYRVYAYNATGNSPYSNEAFAALTGSVPAAPTSLTAVGGTSSIGLAWQHNLSNVQGFKVERKIGVGGTWGLYATLTGNFLGYTDTGVVVGNTYYYRVYAYNATGNSPYSNEAFAALTGSVPAAPTSLTAVGGTSSIGLAWQHNLSNVQGFKVERKIGAGGTWGLYATLTGSFLGYTDTGVVAGNTYYYRVYAYNATGNSPNSNEAFASLQGAPAAPTSLTAVGGTSSIGLAWQHNLSNVQGFKVERKIGAGGTWGLYATLTGNFLGYTDTGVVAGNTYYYRVYAYNATGNSPNSNEASASLQVSISPTVQTLSPSTVTANSAQLNGYINPNGSSTTAYFQYGITTSYGSQTTPGNFGTTPQNISYTITGLAPNTIYHYRIVASNAGGGVNGTDASFTTASGQASLDVTPSTIAFPSIQVGQTSDRTFTVSNVGPSTFSGTASVPAPFSIVSGSSYTLTHGQSQIVTVRYAPTVVGNNTANVTFTGGGGQIRQVTGSAFTDPTPLTGAISGQVTRGDTHEPLNGMAIRINGEFSARAITGIDNVHPPGTYWISGLTPGVHYQVTAGPLVPQLQRFTTVVANDVTVTAGQTTPLDFTLMPVYDSPPNPTPENTPVVLVRGRGKDRDWDAIEKPESNYWASIRTALRAQGFLNVWDCNEPENGILNDNGHVINGTNGISANAEQLRLYIQQKAEKYRNERNYYPPKIHFVAHSMGGLIIRKLLGNDNHVTFNNSAFPGRIGKVVMLATPHSGTPVADFAIDNEYNFVIGINVLDDFFGGLWESTRDVTRHNMIWGFNLTLPSWPPIPLYLISGSGYTFGSDTELKLGYALITAANISAGPDEVTNDGVVTKASANGIYGVYAAQWPFHMNRTSVALHEVQSVSDLDVAGKLLDHYSILDDTKVASWVVNTLLNPAATPTAFGTSGLIAPLAAIRLTAGALAQTTVPMQQLESAAGTMAFGSSIAVPVVSDAGTSLQFQLFAADTNTIFRLIDPSGSLIDTSTPLSNTNVQYAVTETASNLMLATYTIATPTGGTWTAVIDGSRIAPPRAAYRLTAFGDSYVGLIPQTGAFFSQGQDAVVSCLLADLSTNPAVAIQNASITVAVQLPDGSTNNLTLFDDGLHNDGAPNDGVYAAVLANNQQPGSYSVSYRAFAQNSQGQLFQRVASGAFVVSSGNGSLLGDPVYEMIDTNGDSVADFLSVNCWVNPKAAGTFILSGDLVDATGAHRFSKSAQFTADGSGPMLVTLIFDLAEIRATGGAGDYHIENLQLFEVNTSGTAWLDVYHGSSVIQIRLGDPFFYAWLAAYNLPTDGSADYADSDGDGQNNYAEYLAGTDPTNSVSSFRITGVERIGADIRVSFTSVSGKYYCLDRCDSIGGTWTNLLDNIPGNAGIQQATDIGGASRATAFYRVRLSQGNGSTDTVGDGIPDAWRAQYFPNVDPTGTTTDNVSCATCDPDGDGLSNLQEYLAGTDPTNSASAFRITAVEQIAADIRVSFTSVSGKFYTLVRCDSIGGGWANIVDNIPGNDDIQQATDIGGASRASAFYRVRLNPSGSPAEADSDGDGIPDAWMQMYFGHPTGQAGDNSRASDDRDGDGMLNIQEYQTGTDPTNSASAFRILSVAQESNNIRITWFTAGGHTNAVRSASNLGGSYSDVSPNIIVTGSGDTTTNYLDIGAVTNSPARFYRVRLVP